MVTSDQGAQAGLPWQYQIFEVDMSNRAEKLVLSFLDRVLFIYRCRLYAGFPSGYVDCADLDCRQRQDKNISRTFGGLMFDAYQCVEVEGKVEVEVGITRNAKIDTVHRRTTDEELFLLIFLFSINLTAVLVRGKKIKCNYRTIVNKIKSAPMTVLKRKPKKSIKH